MSRNVSGLGGEKSICFVVKDGKKRKDEMTGVIKARQSQRRAENGAVQWAGGWGGARVSPAQPSQTSAQLS